MDGCLMTLWTQLSRKLTVQGSKEPPRVNDGTPRRLRNWWFKVSLEMADQGPVSDQVMASD